MHSAAPPSGPASAPRRSGGRRVVPGDVKPGGLSRVASSAAAGASRPGGLPCRGGPARVRGRVLRSSALLPGLPATMPIVPDATLPGRGTGRQPRGRSVPIRSSATSGAPACCRCSSCTSGGGAVLRQPADRAHRGADRGALAVNPNTMYPLLRPLEARGLVAGEWEHPERRSRRYYRITAAGEAERSGSRPRSAAAGADRSARSRRSARRCVSRRARRRSCRGGSSRRRSCGTTSTGGRRGSTASAMFKLEGDWPKVGRAADVGLAAARPRARRRSGVTGVRGADGADARGRGRALRGTQTVAFEVASGDEVQVTLTLDYELKQRTAHAAGRPPVIRRALRESLRRTLARFGHERRAEIEPITRS